MGKVKNWTVEKKDKIERILINMWAAIGMDIPNNFEDIVQECYEDVCETADPVDWHSGDVRIAFRRWIEKQGMSDTDNVQNDYVKFPITESEPEPPIPVSSKTHDGAILIPVSGLDGMYGVKLKNLGELRSAMSELSDDDTICIETCDEHGDVIDLYPMSIDVISGIEVTNGKTVNEIRFCQRPNSEPDTRDKSELVDRVIDVLMKDSLHGDETVMDELLKKLPWNILKYSLPEPMWKDFDTFTDAEIMAFKNEWGQENDEINSNLGLEADSTEYLMGMYFWLEAEQKWYPKVSSLYDEKEQEIANHLR